jgi:hypothetical protein
MCHWRLHPPAGTVADALTVPASVGEFWMIGYLLIRGIHARTRPGMAVPATS